MAEENSTDYVVKLRVDTSEARLPSQEFQRMASISGLIGRTLTQSITKANIPAKSLLKTFQEVEASAEKIGKYLARGTTDAITASFAKGLKSAVDSVIGELGTSIGEAIQAGLDRVTGKAGIRKDNPTGIAQMVSGSNLAKTVSDSNNVAQQQQQAQAKSAQDVSTYVTRTQKFVETMNMVTREHISDLEQVGKVMQATGADTETATKAVQDYAKSMENAATKPNLFQGSGKNDNTPPTAVGRIDISDVIKKTDELTQKTAQATGEVQQQAAQKAEASGKKAESIVQRIHDAWQKLNAPITVYSAKMVAVQNKLDGLYKAMAKLEDKQLPTEQWKELQANIRAVTKNIEDASGFALSMGDDPNENQGIVRMKEALAGLEEQERQLVATNQVYIDQTKTNQYAVLASQVKQYEARLEELRSKSGTAMSPLLKGLKSVGSAIVKIGWGLTKELGSKFVNVLKKAGQAVLSFFKTLRKKAADNTVTRSIDNLTKKFTNLWSMFVTRMKRKLVAAMFDDVKGVFQQIAQINPAFNESVSGMVNSARQLGAQIIAIVEPIIARLGPYISQMLDMLTAVADKVAQFTAKAFGYDMYSKAEKGNFDYAKSVDETTDSTKKATKAAKEYENTVMGFDQLNELNGTDDGSSVEDDTSAKLERAAAEANAFNHIGESIWNALNNKDYYGAGTAMAAAVNSAFGWLDNTFGWENNAARLTEKFQNLGDIVNGFIDNLRAADIGHAFGNILNTAINGLDILMNDPEHGLHFDKLGENIGTMIIKAVQTINWEGLGSGLAGALTGIGTALMKALTTTVENSDTGEEETLAKSLGNAVLKFLHGVNEKLNPSEIGDAVSSVINTITEFFATAFSDTNEWAKLGYNLGHALTDALRKMDKEQMKEAMYNFFYSLGAMLGEFCREIDWGEALKTLFDGIRAGISGAVQGVVNSLAGPSKWSSIQDMAKSMFNVEIPDYDSYMQGDRTVKDLSTGRDWNNKAMNDLVDMMWNNTFTQGYHAEDLIDQYWASFEKHRYEPVVDTASDGVANQQASTPNISDRIDTLETKLDQDNANSAKEGSDVDALVKSTSELTEAIKSSDKDMTINLGGMPFAKLVLTALNQLNTQYGQGLV